MNFVPTNLPPGSVEKVALLRQRHENNQPLWHKDDRTNFEGVQDNQIYTGKQRKEKRRAYEPRMSRVVSSGKKMRAE